MVFCAVTPFAVAFNLTVITSPSATVPLMVTDTSTKLPPLSTHLAPKDSAVTYFSEDTP